MSQPLQNVNIGSPGFLGVNTEDSAINLDTNFAVVADNAVIDRYGRLGARKGFDLATSYDRSELLVSGTNYNPITNLFYFEDESGNNNLLASGNGKLFTVDEGDGSLTDDSPGSYTINNDDWCYTSLQDNAFLFQAGQAPLTFTDAGGYATTTDIPAGKFAISAFGRLWVAGVTDATSTVYWSDLLDGTEFTTGSSGSIDISTVWPQGYDEVTGIAAYNDFLVIFGRDNIVVYSGADSPSTMAVSDTIGGLGCVGWRTIQDIGNEILYLSRSGVRSFNRTIQGGALPISDVSNNIRREIVLQTEAVLTDNSLVDAVFYPEDYLYLITFRASEAPWSYSTTYAFDVRQPMQDGSFRVTRWPGSPFYTLHNHQGTLWAGNEYGVGSYSGYQDLAAASPEYRFKWYSVFLTFGEEDKLKFLKQIRGVFISSTVPYAQIYWGYGYSRVFKSQTVPLNQATPSQFFIDEFEEAEFGGGVTFSEPKVKPFGSGSTVTIGIEATIDGGSLSLQEVNVQTLLGRLQ